MKSFLFVVCIFITSSVSVYGQQGEDAFFLSGKSKESKIFKNAIINGRQSGHFYIIRNDKGKNITTDELFVCAIENDFLIGNTSKKEVKRFGDFSTVFNVFEFLPKSEFSQYVFECMCPNRDYFSMRNNGSVYVYKSDKNEKVVFNKNSDAIWSGDVGENGKINGTGYGFIEVSPTHFIQFEGTFHNGLPEGGATFYEYQRDHYGKFDNRTTDWQIQTGTMVNGMLWFKNSKGLYGFIDADGNVICDPIFTNVSNFNNEGVASVEKEGYKFTMDKKGTLLYYDTENTIEVYDMMKFCHNNPEFRGAVENTIMLAAENDNPSMDELMQLEDCFPGLSDRLLPLKHKIYDPMADSILITYNIAVKASQGNVKYADVKAYQEEAQRFVVSNTHKIGDDTGEVRYFDPRELVFKAGDIFYFCMIVKDLEEFNNRLNSDAMYDIRKDLEKDLKICERWEKEQNDFQVFASKVYGLLKQKETQIEQKRIAGLKKAKRGDKLIYYTSDGGIICTLIHILPARSKQRMLVLVDEIIGDDMIEGEKTHVSDLEGIDPFINKDWEVYVDNR